MMIFDSNLIFKCGEKKINCERKMQKNFFAIKNHQPMLKMMMID